jgi:hypothetical protein
LAGTATLVHFWTKADTELQRSASLRLLILNLLKEKLWDGVWVSSYGGTKYLGEMPRDPRLGPSLKLPAEQKRRLDDIKKAAGTKGGCFDVLAWRDGQFV